MPDKNDPGPAAHRALKLIGLPVLLVLVVALVGAPAIALAPTPLAGGIMFIFAGIVPASLACLYDRGLAFVTALGTAALVALVEIVKPWPWAGTTLMIAVGLLVGASALRGWHPIASLACGWPTTFLIGPAFSAPAAPWATAGTAGVLVPTALTVLGGLWAVLVGIVVFRRIPRAVPQPQPHRACAVYGIALAVLLGISTFVTATWFPGTNAGWVLLTIFVIVRPGLSDTRRRVVHRSVGTILGGAAALLALAVPIHGLLLAVGALATAATVVFQVLKVHYAVYTFSLTLAIVLLSSPGADVAAIDLQRVGFTLAGALAIAGLMAITTPLLPLKPHDGADRGRHSAERSHRADAADWAD